MAMDDSRPFLVLGSTVSSYEPQQEQWQPVECSTKKAAHGCGPLGEHLLHGVSLLARLGADDDPELHPGLCVVVDDGAFARVAAEIPDELAEHSGRGVGLAFSVAYAAGGDAVAIDLSFVASHYLPTAFVSYFLVYSSGDKSLTLLPSKPDPLCPLLRRHGGGGGEAMAMILMAVDLEPRCRDDGGPWGDNKPVPRLWPRKAADGGGLHVDAVFSCHGMAFWADLGEGLLHCPASGLLDAGAADVELGFVELPAELRIRHYEETVMETPISVYRSMGCAGGSAVWFVHIRRPATRKAGGCVGDTRVEVWALDLLKKKEDYRWEKKKELALRSIWELEGFREKRLPETAVPMYPFLRQQDDGVLYLLLPDYQSPAGGSHLLGIHMGIGSGSSSVRLVSCRSLALQFVFCGPVVLPPDFFSTPRH